MKLSVYHLKRSYFRAYHLHSFYLILTWEPIEECVHCLFTLFASFIFPRKLMPQITCKFALSPITLLSTLHSLSKASSLETNGKERFFQILRGVDRNKNTFRCRRTSKRLMVLMISMVLSKTHNKTNQKVALLKLFFHVLEFVEFLKLNWILFNFFLFVWRQLKNWLVKRWTYKIIKQSKCFTVKSLQAGESMELSKCLLKWFKRKEPSTCF